MRCLLMECEDEAVYPFKFCTSLHGKMVNVTKDTLKRIQDPTIQLSKASFLDWCWYFEGNSPSLEQCEYYLQLI